MNSKISQILFFLLLGITAWFRVWLTEYQPLFVIGSAVYDDRLFMSLAQHILNGEWLGSYNVLTLIKGPFFPLWTAAANILNIPLLSSAQILYVISCLIFVSAVKPLLNKRLVIFLCFIFLLFNPASFDAGLTRATRELIYPSVTLLVIACAFGVFLSIVRDTRYAWIWGMGLGIAYGCFWITREEGIWIVPFLIFVAVCTASLFFLNWRTTHFWKFIKPWLLFILCSALIVNSISLLNYINYGVYAKTEIDTNSYNEAYGALARVKPAKVIRYVSVTKETRMRIYKVSPAFRELKGYLEGPLGDLWADFAYAGDQTDENRNEITAGLFLWAFREAVSYKGYYSSGRYPDDFYRRVASEVNAACDSGALDCFPPRASLTPVWYWYYLKYFGPSTVQRMIALTNFQNISVQPIQSRGTGEQIALFRNVTREKIWLPGTPLESSAQDSIRSSLLSAILSMYQFLMPALSIYSVMTYFVILYQFVRIKKNHVLVIVLSSLLILVLSRVLLLALINVTSFSFPAVAYLHSAYVIWLAFVFLAVLESSKVVATWLSSNSPLIRAAN